MTHRDQALDNLWLARAMYELGAVTFGDYTLGGSTVNSPVFVNPKLLISNPTALRVAARGPGTVSPSWRAAASRL